MIKPFDKTKDYASIFGLSGAKYEQNGQYYNAHFKPCDADGNVISDNQENVVVEEPKEDVGPVPVLKTDDLEETLKGMHYRKLMALVKEYGGTWTNKKAAIQYLLSLNVEINVK